MSTDSVDKLGKGDSVPLYGLKKTVGPKARVSEVEIHEKAKAGLEAVIDFREAANVLKITEKDSKGRTINKPEELRGSHPIRLIHVKGQRKLQIRMVEPKTRSFNKNDVYVVITPTKVAVWNGKDSSLMKRAKADDFAKNVIKLREFGCSAKNVTVYQHFGKTIHQVIVNLLNDNEDVLHDKQDISDTDFEDIIKLNKIYELKLNDQNQPELILDDNISGKPLKRSFLNSEKAYIFDFGTEVYIWFGSKYSKSENLEEQQILLNYVEDSTQKIDSPEGELLKKLTSIGYYFPNVSTSRPDWITVEKLNEKCETLLFKKKFVDWPETEFKAPIYSPVDKQSRKRVPINIEKCFNESIHQDYILAGNVINRGKGGIDPDEGFAFSVQTQKLTVFKLENSEFVKTDEDVMSFFFSQQVYLVEWYFIYQRSDIKSLTGEDVDLEGTGRQVCVYFYWQGRDCTVSEKALSAILTIFYVNKKASQVHVGQDSEMPAFVSLFKTHYVSGIGHSDEFNANDHHLYLIRGTNLEECTLLEVEPHFTSLRSQGNFLYVHPASNTIYQWIGRLYNKALDITELLETLHKLFKKEDRFQVQTIEEGEEPEDFLTFLQFPAGKPYSFIASSIQFCCSFRKLDQYKIECNKISCQLSQIKDHNGKPVQYDNFSVHQNDLYSLIQPVLVLVCTTQNTYLWHGWVPPKGNSNNSEQLNDLNILTDKNFLEMKRYILEDLATFLKETTFSEFITQIHAGLEPSDFIQLFPNWKKREDIYLQQLKLGRIADEQPSVSAQQTLSEQIFYPIEVLVKRPLPENVEPGKLENYIEDGEFENLFDMKKEEFSKLPRWKQNELKKSKQLF